CCPRYRDRAPAVRPGRPVPVSATPEKPPTARARRAERESAAGSRRSLRLSGDCVKPCSRRPLPALDLCSIRGAGARVGLFQQRIVAPAPLAAGHLAVLLRDVPEDNGLR